MHTELVFNKKKKKIFEFLHHLRFKQYTNHIKKSQVKKKIDNIIYTMYRNPERGIILDVQ